jgi:hypothetical protein
MSRKPTVARTSTWLLCLLVLTVSTAAAWVLQNAQMAEMPEMVPQGAPLLDPDEEIAWVCPMHPDYTSAAAGMCPRDGMALVQSNPYDVRDYRLEFETDPAVVRAGEEATLRFRIFHPGTGEQVRDFVTVHDKRYHLFVISQDMEHFEHIHPEQETDGSWSIPVTLPEEGYYKVLSDFVPYGGSSQFLAVPLVTADYAGDLFADSAHLRPDADTTQTVRGLTSEVTYDPPTFQAGLYGHIRFRLRDAATGQPATDIQPYLGSFGHMLIMSEDMTDYVHSHPLDLANSDDETGPRPLMLPMGVDVSGFRGGPEVTFEGLMPKPGLYRAWTQFQRNDEVLTFVYTFRVGEEDGR